LKDEMRQFARAYKLREVREAQAVTQVELAKDLGIGQNRVSQIERGDIDHSRVLTLRRYVEALGGHLSVEASFGDTRYVLT
jgi:transcriptional regulator with XRE-family HTH domain